MKFTLYKGQRNSLVFLSLPIFAVASGFLFQRCFIYREILIGCQEIELWVFPDLDDRYFVRI